MDGGEATDLTYLHQYLTEIEVMKMFRAGKEKFEKFIEGNKE